MDVEPMNFRRMVLASFQPADYVRAALQPRGGMRFLSRWLALVCFLFGALSALAATQLVQEADERIAMMPEFRLADGKLTVDGPQPIRIDGAGGVLVVIDASGATTINDLSAPHTVILLGPDRVTVRDGSGQRDLRYLDMALPVMTRVEVLEALAWLPLAILLWNLGAWAFWMVLAVLFTAVSGNLATISSQGRVHPLMGIRMAAHAFAIPMAVGASPLVFPGLWPAVFATGSLLTWMAGRAALELPPGPDRSTSGDPDDG